MATLFIHYPPSASAGLTIQTYPTFADFPSSAPNGTLAIALDTDTLYVFNSGTMTWTVVGGGAGNYMVNVFTLTPTDITNKFVILSQAPGSPTDTALTVIDGPMQEYGLDYTVSGSTLSWNGLFLDGILTAGDELIVQFT